MTTNVKHRQHAPPDDQPQWSSLGVHVRRRSAVLILAMIGLFAILSGQFIRLALQGSTYTQANVARPLAYVWARPDITDRHGRLLATDIVTPSLYADPKQIVDADEVVLQLTALWPEMDEASLRRKLAQPGRRFVWLKRGLAPSTAQRIHNFGLPGLAFRNELRRVYPAGRLASHILGSVDIDNRGRAGIERFIDEAIGAEAVTAAGRSTKAPVALTIDIGVQYALRDELVKAMAGYQAKAAAGVVLDIETGEVMAASSLPDHDPNIGPDPRDETRINRLTNGLYELGSVFKMLTLAIALDSRTANLKTRFDTSKPIEINGYTINDSHPAGRWMSVREIFLKSSNIGAARMAENFGPRRLRDYFNRFGIIEQINTEIGAVVKPRLPRYWRPVHTMTIAYGHGISLAPLQFAAAAATVVNGGKRIFPTFIYSGGRRAKLRQTPVLQPGTSRSVLAMLRQNVVSPIGTGRLAAVPGYLVGGKTGTADIARNGTYRKGNVISSFIAVVPTDRPRFLTYIVLFEPQKTAQSNFSRSAGRTAAPVTSQVIERIAPILGLLPQHLNGDM